MEILFISDYVCPYCLVAKEALKQALEPWAWRRASPGSPMS